MTRSGPPLPGDSPFLRSGGEFGVVTWAASFSLLLRLPLLLLLTRRNPTDPVRAAVAEVLLRLMLLQLLLMLMLVLPGRRGQEGWIPFLPLDPAPVIQGDGPVSSGSKTIDGQRLLDDTVISVRAIIAHAKAARLAEMILARFQARPECLRDEVVLWAGLRLLVSGRSGCRLVGDAGIVVP